MIVLALASAGAAAVRPIVASKARVTTMVVRVEGQSRTLLAATTVRVPSSGYITKGGTPPKVCPANSAAGAFNAATRGRWTAKYYPGVTGGIFITSILGEKPAGNNYWTVFVNNRTASLGVCAIKPRPGEQLLLAVTTGTQLPLVLSGPARARASHTVTVTVGYWRQPKKGAAVFTRLRGVRVTGKGIRVTTDAKGIARIRVKRAGTLTLVAQDRGYVRAPLRITVLR